MLCVEAQYKSALSSANSSAIITKFSRILQVDSAEEGVRDRIPYHLPDLRTILLDAFERIGKILILFLFNALVT
jgi:hypothetical protein